MVSTTRHINSPKEYSLQPTGRATIQDKIYIGFVKYVDDAAAMGRLKVWIPELGGDPTDAGGWYIMSYCSPFAGATNVQDNKNDNSFSATQKSYGMWFVPPDINNEVVCAFINGDPGRGIWFGCLYQQNMNHMVPGLPGNNSSPTLPVAEYNKKITQTNLNAPDRPFWYPLADQLKLQGLDQDTIRGTSSSGARRIDPQLSVYGWLTPGGNQLVYDDNPANSYIRFRTANGAQILINDTTGCIYMNSVDGKNWFSMDANGRIDVYGYGDISIRSQGSLNLRADQDVNIEAGQNINIRARGTTAVTPVVNPQANVPQPVPPTPGPTAIIGDDVAVALSSRIPGATAIAQAGFNSDNATLAVISNSDGTSGIINGVISLGANDSDQALLLSNIDTIRSTLNASNYVWILPYNSASAATIKSYAVSKGDQILNLANYPTIDNQLPRDFNIVTNDLTALLKPADPAGGTAQQTGSTGNVTAGSSASTQPQNGSGAGTSAGFVSNNPVSNSPNPVPAPATTGTPGGTVAAASTTSTNIGSAPPPGTTTTSVLVPFLKQVEGKSNRAYWDTISSHHISIGYGHQIKQNEYAQGYIDTGTAGRIAVSPMPSTGQNPPGNANATDDQCTALLSIDVAQYIAGAQILLGGAWDLLGPYQQAALSSIYYNSPATLKRLVGQGLTNYINNKDTQGAANLIAGAGPAQVASRRVKESNLYMQRTDLLGSGGSDPLPGQPAGGNNNVTPGTGDSQHAPGTLAQDNPNLNNGFIRIQSTNSMHILSNQYLFLTSGADMHRFAGANMFDTAGTNWNRAAGGFVHETAGQDFSIGAGSELNLNATRIDLNGVQPPLAIAAVSAQGPDDINQQDGQLNSIGNVVPILTSTIVYHLPYHEPYDDHGGRNAYGIQNTTIFNTNTKLRAGEVIPNSPEPLNLIGTPLSSMPAGIYQGAGYNTQNQPIYSYKGPLSSSNAAIQPASSMQVSQQGIQFMEGYENGSYVPVVVGEPPVTQIGYGHNLTPDEVSSGQITINGSSYSLYNPLSQQLIGQLFEQDIATVQSWMQPIVSNVLVTQTQYDMLCSLAFNIGQTNFSNSQVIKELVAGNLQNVPNLWMQWTINGAGNLVPQLVQRRLAEATNFMLAPFRQTVPDQGAISQSNIGNSQSGAVAPLTPSQ